MTLSVDSSLHPLSQSSIAPNTQESFRLAATLSHPQLTQALEKKLRQAWQKDPSNLSLLKALGLLYRRQGDLAAAKQTYRQLGQLTPQDPMAAYLSAIFNQSPLPSLETHQAFKPTPFVWLPNFLPPDEHRAMIPFALKHQADFEPAGVGTYDTLAYRKRQNLVLKDMGSFGKMFKLHILELLPDILSQLDLHPFEIVGSEVKMTNYYHDAFFHYHSDGSYKSDFNVLRRVSFVYYFYQEPKAFNGGDLLLCDTKTTAKSPITGEYDYQVENFTRIIPANNCLVVFPSNYVHAVTPVGLKEPWFSKGRFAISGHIHQSLESLDSEAAA